MQFREELCWNAGCPLLCRCVVSKAKENAGAEHRLDVNDVVL